MPAPAESNAPASGPAPAGEPARYRLVVRSAAEAVALVRQRFGEDARVIAVRQLEAGGLARFLQKPRLEVIVDVGAPEPAPAAAPAPQALAAPEAPAPVSPAEPTPESAAGSNALRAIAVLRATGLDESILERIRADHPGLDWGRTATPEALARLAAWLRSRYAGLPPRPVGPRRVFLGGAGVGKTTALCKALALDVFVHGRRPAVLKLDGEQPNATDGLAAFCDVLDAPLLRSAAEIEEFDDEALLYLDVPGLSLDAAGEHGRLARTLDALRVDTRVLVVNATCECEVIADTFDLGRACGATHVVFTHADEVRRPGKLWRFVLFGGLRPLFLGAGPSPAGDIEEDVFSALLSRTIPRDLARAAGAEGGRR